MVFRLGSKRFLKYLNCQIFLSVSLQPVRLSASRKSNSILPVFHFFLFINWFKSTKPGSPVKPRYLYNETVLSCFSFCLSLSINVTSVVSGGIVNDVSGSILLVSGVV